MTKFTLHDKLQVWPGYFSHRTLLVYAETKKAADVTARIHHSIILRQLGLL